LAGRTAEQIAEELPTLGPDLIHQVLDYYQDHQCEINAYVAAYRSDLERQAAELHTSPSADELRQRWIAKGLGALP
jgi:glycine/D-amino acid oxidase-like deaminating enzyme